MHLNSYLQLSLSLPLYFMGAASPRLIEATCPSPDPWPSGPGKSIPPFQPPPALRSALSRISSARIESTITKLVSFGTRHTLSTQNSTTFGIGAARDWLASELRSYGGRLNVSTPGYIQQPASRVPFPVVISNVVATLPGTTDPGRVYVISGHYDSRISDALDYTGVAPGANDDASGVAVVLEVARVLANSSFPATLVFAAVAGEEQGLFGSAFLAKTLKDEGKDVQGMFSNDIVGSSTGDDGKVDAHSIRLFAQGLPIYLPQNVQQQYASVGGENDSPARQLARLVQSVASGSHTDMAVRIVYRLDRFLRGGDQRPFLEAGFPAARFTEPNENFAHQHQDVRIENGVQYGDLLQFVDFEYAARVAKVNLATLWVLALAPGTPKEVRVDTGGLENNSTFTWKVGGDAEGYEVVWRGTTESEWRAYVPAGRTGRVSVDLSKDNAVFGVRSVGANGYMSPAVLPLP